MTSCTSVQRELGLPIIEEKQSAVLVRRSRETAGSPALPVAYAFVFLKLCMLSF